MQAIRKILVAVAVAVMLLVGSVVAAAPANASGSCYTGHCGQLFNYGSTKILVSGGQGGWTEYIYPGSRTERSFDYDAYRVPPNKCYQVSIAGSLSVKCGGSAGAWFPIGNSQWVQAYPR